MVYNMFNKILFNKKLCSLSIYCKFCQYEFGVINKKLAKL